MSSILPRVRSGCTRGKMELMTGSRNSTTPLAGLAPRVRGSLAGVALLTIAAGAGAGYWAGSRTTAESGAADLREELATVAQRLDSLERAQLRMALSGSPASAAAAAGTANRPTAASAAARPAASDASEPSAADRTAAFARFGAVRQQVRASIDRLRETQDPAEKLALARELAQSPMPRVRLAGLRALVEADPAAGLASIRELVGEASREGRGQRGAAQAVSMLADVQGNSVDQELHAYTRDPSPGVQRAALRALEQRGDARPIQASIASRTPGLRSEDAGTRTRAVEEIGDLRSPSGASAIIPMLGDPDSGVRIEALRSLARTGAGAPAAAAVQPLLSDPVPAVRDTAVRALQRLSRAPSPAGPAGSSSSQSSPARGAGRAFQPGR
jgi:HEAT repeat protein